MRVAHLTDLHVMRPPSLDELTVKRLLGSANLYVVGRSGHFTEAAQRAAVAAVERLAPDGQLVLYRLVFEGVRGDDASAHLRAIEALRVLA